VLGDEVPARDAVGIWRIISNSLIKAFVSMLSPQARRKLISSPKEWAFPRNKRKPSLRNGVAFHCDGADYLKKSGAGLWRWLQMPEIGSPDKSLPWTAGLALANA